jgi:hypothetical protein
MADGLLSEHDAPIHQTVDTELEDIQFIKM